jgi:diadenosine tetraphosphatase ApaH/serine/threonine PP2A family protein phosphatase
VRRPLLARPHPSTRASTVVAAAAALAVVGGAVRAAAGGDAAGTPRGDGAPHAIAAGVRRLRAAVVGDVSGDASRDASRDARVVAAGADGRTLTATTPGGGERVRLRVSRGVARAFTPGVPWWADSAHWGADVVRWTETTRAPVVVDAGDTVALAPPPLPAALPEALRRRGVRWYAEGAAALAGGASGGASGGGARLVARAPGLATATAFSPAGRTVVPVRVRAAVRGRVYAVSAGGAVAGADARVVVQRRDGGAPDTAYADASGRFRAPLPDGWAGEADVRVEPLGGGHDAVTLAGVDAAALHTLGVVLPPARWTIAAGEYAGEVVPVRAAAARGYWRAAAAGRPVGWADDAARSVAFDPSAAPLDTAVFWAAARGLSRAWGRPLFRAAAAGEAADVTVGIAPGLSAAGVTTLSYDGTGLVAGARVEFRSAATAADARVAAHELLHALGFGHARGWPSLVGLAGHGGPAAATPADVAHGHLLEAIRRAAREADREYGAAFGWAGGRP